MLGWKNEECAERAESDILPLYSSSSVNDVHWCQSTLYELTQQKCYQPDRDRVEMSLPGRGQGDYACHEPLVQGT